MILCTCGWGDMRWNAALPHFCPMCGFNLWSYFGQEDEDE